MPCDRRLYPADWPAIRQAILLRAGGQPSDPRIGARCEWCGVENYAVGRRDAQGRFQPAGTWTTGRQYAASYAEAAAAAQTLNEAEEEAGRYIVIVLTIAHVHDADPRNVDPANLAALCQRCHNRHDQHYRQQRAHLRRTGAHLAPDAHLAEK